MDQKTDNNLEFRDKLGLFLKKHKFKIVILISVLILIMVSFTFFNISQQKKNNLAAEKFVKANIYLSSNNKKKSKEIYEEIIYSKNKFYSILSLNIILEKKLEDSKVKILQYFEIIEDLSISSEQKNLLILKKALYLLKNSDIEEGKKLLKNLSDSEPQFKILLDQILNN